MGVGPGRGWRAMRSRCCGWLLAVVLLPALADERPTITLTTGETHDQTTLVVEHIMTQAYARLGYSLRVVRLPLRRGLAQANAGVYDGELFRVMSITEEFPNLEPVPTPIGAVEFYAFALQPLQLAGWPSLAAYRLGGEMGIKHVEYNTRGMRISYTAKPEQLLLMLKAGRIEVAILEKNSARLALRDLAERGELLAGLHALGLIDQVPLYSFLHHKHAALLPKVDQALRELVAEGLIRRAWDESNTTAAPVIP
jgi:polar amino acid transport system substrate-binding protein